MGLFSSEKEVSNSYKSVPKLLQPLWFAAGADPELLKDGTYNDQIKMACLGGTVYATSLLAFFSGSYAIHIVFSEDINSEISLLSWLMGAIWALIIFNLDRFIVSSTAPNIGEQNSFSKIFSIPFFTRIILGVIIGLVISTPLEIKIFEKDIQKEILAKQPKLMDSLFVQMLKDNSQYNGLKNDSIKLETEIKKFKELATDNNNKYREETEGKRTGNIGIGTVAKNYKREEQDANSKTKNYENDLQYLNNKIISLKDSLKKNVKENESVISSGLNSLVSKASMPSEINFTISLFIILFLLAIELTPILLKTFMESSPYDFQKKDRDDFIIIKSKTNKEKLILANNKENQLQLNNHSNAIKERERQFNEQLKIEEESFNEKLSTIKTQMDDLIKEKINVQLAKKFNEIFDADSQRNYLMNLKSQNEYIDELNERQIQDENRKLITENELEKIQLNRVLQKTERKIIEDVELLKNNRIKEQQIQNIDNNLDKTYQDLLRKNNLVNEEQVKDKLIKEKQVKEELIKEQQIKDELISNKFWKPGENFNNTKILCKKTILDLVNEDETIAQRLYNSEKNTLITDAKLSQYNRNKNIDEAIVSYNQSTNNLGINFNLEEAKKRVLTAINEIKEAF